LPGIPPHKPLPSSAVKFKREHGLAPMAAPALADRHRNPQDARLPRQGSPGAGPCCESCSWSGRTIAAGGPLRRALSSSVWPGNSSSQRADSYPERARC
jgi:hypothetical protein